MEIWKPIPNHRFYEASSLGRIRSIDRNVMSGKRMISLRGMVLAQATGKSPCNLYPRVVVTDNTGKHKTRTVHYLVCEAFHGPRPDGLEVLHRDDCKDNNKSDNLRWGTKAENATDAKANGSYRRSINKRRAGVGWQPVPRKLTVQSVLLIRAIAEMGIGHQQIADAALIDRSMVSQICRRVTWRHI